MNPAPLAAAPPTNPVQSAFAIPGASTLHTSRLNGSVMAATELRCDSSHFGLTSSMPVEPAYLVALQLRGCPKHELFFEGRGTKPKDFEAGTTSIFDLRLDPVADITSPFHSIHFYLPQRALDDLAADAGHTSRPEVTHPQGVSVRDPVVFSLISSLRPLMPTPERANRLLIDHVALALCAHVVDRYCGMPPTAAAVTTGGLTARQERTAKELMVEHLDGDLGLREIADACGLSERHFSRAFKRSEGVTPHRWLLQMRVERAKDLMKDGRLSLAEVGLACGFSDQSHFSRTFQRSTGCTPGQWRRKHYR